MRILLVGDYLRDSRLGSTKVMLKLQEEFCALGHTCDVVLGDDLGRLPRHRTGHWALAPLGALAAARRAFRTNGRYDVIDAASAEGLWIGCLHRLGAFPGTAIVSRSNGLEHLNYERMLADAKAGLLDKPWSRRWFYPAVRMSQVAGAARVADRLILLNEADRTFAIARGWKRPRNIDVVPHGVSARFLAPPPPDAARGRGILFCGSWDLMKGVPYLVDAFARLVHRGATIEPAHAPVKLTVLGGGMSADAIRSAFPSAVRSRVTVIDRVGEDEVMAAYRSHDVLAFPSTYEGFGMVLMEAMSQRLPVVTTPVGCATTLVRDGKSGLLVPPRDPDALSDALVRLLHDPQLRTKLADAGAERVRDMSWSETARATLAVYQRAMAPRAAVVHA